jgi:hypothetical protein
MAAIKVPDFKLYELERKAADILRRYPQCVIHDDISPCCSWSGIGNDSGRNAYAFRSKDVTTYGAMYSGLRVDVEGVNVTAAGQTSVTSSRCGRPGAGTRAGFGRDRRPARLRNDLVWSTHVLI